MHAPPHIALCTPLPISRTASPAPTPASSTLLRSPSTSSSSKVERLLRETLRRADRRTSSSSSAARLASPVPSRTYARHEVLVADSCARDSDSDDEDCSTSTRTMPHATVPTTQSRRPSYSLSSPHKPSPSPSSPYHPHPHPHHHHQYRQHPSPSPSPSPRAAHQRHHRATLSMSSAPSPVPVPTIRQPTPLRPDPSALADRLLPHERALRSRLQGVLVLDADRRTGRSQRSATTPSGRPTAAAAQGHSRSRSVSVRAYPHTHTQEDYSQEDEDAAWWAPKVSHTTPASPMTEATPSLSLHSYSGDSLDADGDGDDVFTTSPPSTPPSPSLSSLDHSAVPPPRVHGRDRPSFDARTASALCRNTPGLVSFRDVEGLGAPPDFEDDLDVVEGEEGKKGWWDLYSWSPFKRKDAAASAGKRLSLSA